MNNDSKFSSGFLMGFIVGGGAVFLLGTKTGKNLLKILSEQGLDGLLNLLEEYGLEEVDEEYEGLSEDEEIKPNGYAKETRTQKVSEEKKETPKRRFFKRIRR